MKIIATISTKCSEKDFDNLIETCLSNYVNNFRFNLAKFNEEEYDLFTKKCKLLHSENNILSFDIPFPGMKPRIFIYEYPRHITKGEFIYCSNSTKSNCYINVDNFYNYFKLGNNYYYQDGIGFLTVEYISASKIVFRSENEFVLCSGKSLTGGETLKTHINKRIIDLLNNVKPEEIWLSFVEEPMCESLLLSYLEYSPRIFYKIETLKSYENIYNLLTLSDADIVIARGDLGTSFCYNLIDIQYNLLKMSKKFNKMVYLATDFLKSMNISTLPSRADMIDIQFAVQTQCDGIMLNVSNLFNNFSHQVEYIRRCEEQIKRSC